MNRCEVCDATNPAAYTGGQYHGTCSRECAMIKYQVDHQKAEITLIRGRIEDLVRIFEEIKDRVII